jgi:hypothetical protein
MVEFSIQPSKNLVSLTPKCTPFEIVKHLCHGFVSDLPCSTVILYSILWL